LNSLKASFRCTATSITEIQQLLSDSIIVLNYCYSTAPVLIRRFAFAIWIAALCKFFFGHFAANASSISKSMSASVILNNHRNLHRRCYTDGLYQTLESSGFRAISAI